MKLKKLLLISLPMIALNVGAASVDEARQLAEDGRTDEAIAMLRELEASSPRDAEVSLQLGNLLQSTGHDAEALQAYTSAQKKGSREAVLALAELANLEYRIDDARTLLANYRSLLKKGKKTLYPDQSGDLDQRIDRTETMLERVEQIEVIDSLVVDADEFFKSYHLSPESGSFHAPADVLPEGFTAAEPTVVYEPESGRQMIWAAPDADGTFKLYSSSALYGDTWEQPTALGDDLGDGGDANYPYLMPDGVTLYFANDGDNSLGGLDIFISRRGDDGFLQPQNVGMPYNSPYDDYLLAIDELTGAGWWATDRNRIPGKVTIYVFIPNELRHNVDVDSPELIARARLTSIRTTWNADTDRNALINRIVAARDNSATREKQFEIAIPGRGVYTNYDDFRTSQARSAMKKLVLEMQQIEQQQQQLDKLRAAYAAGNHSNEAAIVAAEQELETAKAQLVTLRNDVITLER